ncbi:unnamed protein product [Rhizophagus irregularis]|nr:unnamed protein product [Rhizophagus irregularis]
MGVLYWRDIVDMLWAISAGLDFIHERDLIHGHLHGGNILVEKEINSIDTKIADTGLHDADPSNRPTASQLCEYLGNWTIAICDDPEPSDLSNQFSVAEEIRFSSLKQLQFNILSCHERAIYSSRSLNISEPFLYRKL